MNIEINHEGKHAALKVSGRIDEQGAEKLKSEFYNMDRSLIFDIVFDFKDVSYIGSAGIGKLLLFYKEMDDVAGSIKIVNASDTVFDLLKIVKLDTLFSISRGNA